MYKGIFHQDPDDKEVRAFLALVVLSCLESMGMIPFPAKISIDGEEGSLYMNGTIGAEKYKDTRLGFLRDYVSRAEVEVAWKLLRIWKTAPAPDFFRHLSAQSPYAKWVREGNDPSLVKYALEKLHIPEDQLIGIHWVEQEEESGDTPPMNNSEWYMERTR